MELFTLHELLSCSKTETMRYCEACAFNKKNPGTVAGILYLLEQRYFAYLATVNLVLPVCVSVSNWIV
jgi:hypothetical protein